LLNVLKYFLPYLKGYKREFIFVIFGIIATAVATVFTAHIIKPILDDIFIAKDEDMLHIIPLFLVLIYLIKSVGRYFQAYFTVKIGESIVMRLRNEMLEKILYFDMQYINSIRSGELISRINGDIMRVRYIVSEMLPELSREVVTILGLVGYVIYQNPLLAFYTLVILPVTFYPLSILAKKMKSTSKDSQEKSADLVSKLSELFNSIEIIKANSTEKVELESFKKENRSLFFITMRGTKIFNFVSPMMETYSSLSIALVIIFGGRAVIDGDMSVGSFFAFLTAVGLLFDPIKKVSAIFNKMQDGVSATERIIQLLSVERKIIDGDIQVEKIERLEFKGVSFSFGDKKIVENINFQIHRGESIALVGDSGGGKSTLLNLLLRFYDRESGTITINSHKIEDLKLESFRREIATVSQRVYIFNDSILNNVAYGDKVDRDRVIEALKIAEALDFVEKMDRGVDTELQEFGANLSGGQRQRIALARAIYRNSSILILDEATSALDNRVEMKILENLKQHIKDKIVITVAHRLSTVRDVDRILLVSNGHIVADGTHTDLLKFSDEYKRLNGSFESE
jgi:subfamily B ATP-binding cassette protein MsbA